MLFERQAVNVHYSKYIIKERNKTEISFQIACLEL